MELNQRIVWLSVGLPCLIVLYLFFLVAIASVNRTRARKLREIAKQGNKNPRHARLILLKAESFLQSMHAGLLLIAMLTGYMVIRLAGSEGLWGWIVAHNPNISEHFIWQSSLKIVFFFLITAISLVFIQLAKAVAYAAPEVVLMILAKPILLAHRILSPVVAPVKWISRSILSLFGIGLPLEFERALSAEELTEMVEQSTKAGEIEVQEQEMIESVFLFSDTLVEEIMTPRGDIVAVSIAANFEQVVEIFKNDGFSRIVVYGKDLDDVKGVLLAKDLFSWFGKDKTPFAIKNVLRPVFFVQHSRKIDALLKDLRREKVHLAVVLDEHGGVDGIVTLEDILEELVGEIADEFDQGEVTHEVAVDRDDILVEGSMGIDDFNSRYNLAIPIGEYDTVAGFLLALLGHIPKEQESVGYDGVLFTVEEIEQNRVTSIRVQRGRATAANDAQKQSQAIYQIDPDAAQLSETIETNQENFNQQESVPLRILGNK